MPLAPGEADGKSCPICLARFQPAEAGVGCPACRLPYHAECWSENGGCGAFGCRFAPETPKEEIDGPVQTAWGDTKECPRCGKEIQAIAIKCRHCKADLGTRDAISSKEWHEMDRRRKTGDKGRVLAVMCFLMAATCALAPIGASISLWHILSKERRAALDDADRFLHFGAVGVLGIEILLLLIVKAAGW